ncbi:hypothetical protein CONLIGDRAFT_296480 [Coniochaeta ligniaria NRRL 30616]|uniref:Uncharacterized protein n=1 Tax=Coniochaeta ligniaria NRRL 30616 TaxID=1408157 RepID=A0A1J7IUK8_9PEZI|nr:hypothetical protein CONLIGDRAFT_296480 [Coniochaeta ligniaria NRRL 30616]
MGGISFCCVFFSLLYRQTACTADMTLIIISIGCLVLTYQRAGTLAEAVPDSGGGISHMPATGCVILSLVASYTTIIRVGYAWVFCFRRRNLREQHGMRVGSRPCSVWGGAISLPHTYILGSFLMSCWGLSRVVALMMSSTLVTTSWRVRRSF